MSQTGTLLSHKNLLIALAAGGAVLCTVGLYEYFFRKPKQHLAGKNLVPDLKLVGEPMLTPDGLLDKIQAARIVGLAKKYARECSKEERAALIRARAAHLSTHNFKAYMETAIDSLNLEFQLEKDICAEICQKLAVDQKAFGKALDRYNKDSEYIATVNLVSKLSSPKGRKIPEGEIEEVVKSVRTDPSSALNADMQVRIKDSDMAGAQEVIIRMKVCDLLRQDYGADEAELAEAEGHI